MSDAPPAPATGTEGQPPADPAPQGAPADPPTPTPPPPPDPKPTETVEFWRQKSRDWEKKAKGNATAAEELEQLKASMMSEQEKAVAEAEARGRKEATTGAGQRLAAAEIKAALTGVVPDPAAIVEDLNLAKYVTDTGDVDLEAVGALRAKYEALRPTEPSPPVPSPTPGTTPVENLRPGALPTPPPEPTIADQIAAAEKAGDWPTARRLKTQQLIELAKKTN